MKHLLSLSERAREFATTAARMEREREGAAEVVAGHLRNTPLDEWPGLANLPSMRSNAALERLSEEVRKRLERTPVEALAIANLASSIAGSLSDEYPPVVIAQIRSAALRDRANALRYLARLGDAYDSIERAEAELAVFPALAHDRAIVWLVKAMILAQLDRFDEAERTITAARDHFSDVGDSVRRLQAGVIQGNLLARQEKYADARSIFRELLVVAAENRDTETRARVHNNLGYCCTQLNDYRAANVHFSQSIALFTDLGWNAEVARTQRSAGVLFIAKGQKDLGISHLREARRMFRTLGMVEEAGLCALRLMETFVERGQTHEARALATVVIDEFTAAGLDSRAVDAVVNLRASLDVDGASAETVRTVHALVETLGSNQPNVT
jgi:tetratricopeptide (TPR) repeat protein